MYVLKKILPWAKGALHLFCRERARFALTAVGLSLLLISPGIAQDLRQKLRLGHQLEASGRWEAAQQLYEKLYREHPGDIVIFHRLKDACLITQSYERALEIVEARRKLRADPNLDVFTGQIYYKMGRQDEALRLWEDILNRYPKNQGMVHQVANALAGERLLDDAIDVYLGGRKRIGNDHLFMLNLVDLYGARMNYKKATEELLKYYRTHPKQVPTVDNYLSRYPKTDRIVKEVSRQFQEAIAETPDDLVLRKILSNFLMNAERYQESLELTREVERLSPEQSQGQALFLFAQNAFQAGAPQIAAEAYQSILIHYSRFPLRPRVLFGLAQCHEASEQYSEAVEAYQSISDTYSRDALATTSLYRKGIIQKDALFDLDGAIETFQALVTRFPSTSEGKAGLLELGSCHVARGDLDEAETIFQQAMETADKKDRRQWLRALIRLADAFYLHARFQETLELLETLTSDKIDPAALQDPALNDGLDLRLFLQSHLRRSPQALDYLARGDFLLRQHRFRLATAILDSLLTRWPDDPLAAESLFKTGQAHILQEQYEEGLARFDTLLTRFPHHLLADQALERIGWIYEKTGDPQKAQARYETLLVSYPQSFHADDVRRRIRRIEKDQER